MMIGMLQNNEAIEDMPPLPLLTNNLNNGGIKIMAISKLSLCPAKNQWKTHGDSTKGSETYRLYRIWKSMRLRCLNPKDTAYKNYGGRGITICDEWRKYESFRDWALANGYQCNLIIDRRDNDGNYEPGNCRFTTRIVSNRNRRITKTLVAFGEIKPMKAWTEDPRCKVRYKTLCYRISEGWLPEKAITLDPISPKESGKLSRGGRGKII